VISSGKWALFTLIAVIVAIFAYSAFINMKSDDRDHTAPIIDH